MDRGWEKNRVHGITENSEKIVLGSHQHQILMGSRIHKWCWNLSTGSSDRKVTHQQRDHLGVLGTVPSSACCPSIIVISASWCLNLDNKLYDHLSHWWVRVKVDCGVYAVCLVAQSCPALCNSMDCSLLGSLSMGFSRKEYWSGLPFPPPGDLPNAGTCVSCVSCIGRQILYHCATWSAHVWQHSIKSLFSLACQRMLETQKKERLG